ncbi:hydroxymethylglutaryl-CoA lyase [Microvirga zambiensis]|jgi:hydroxymethylglutaryl-CoA lyase|uniref:hydroxymethylglutaryl-CoA lyase n=1 Tax=Microvirga zambiensis TaxID=1402137 RepID=UPI00191FCCB9|nr:hydroxymethylglutaryl-CoA lyase [Microvirga zambiensis]
MSDLPSRVTINEDGPREGFQIESATIATGQKVELVDALSETGLKEIQVTSFVHPKRVPSMADAEEVVRLVRMRSDVRYTGLFLNEQGLRRALATGRLHIRGSISLTASAAFLARNQNATPDGQRQARCDMVRLLQSEGIPVDAGGVNAAFGCNFEGEIPLERLMATVRDVFDLADELGVRIETLGLSDTMAWATPKAIRSAVGAIRSRYPDVRISLHLHDTRGLALANALAGLQMGVDDFDASIGGLGGCPFAAHKGAAGNLCTEDFAFMCEEMGIDTGLDLERLVAAAELAERIVGHPLPGSVKMGGLLSRYRAAANAA